MAIIYMKVNLIYDHNIFQYSFSHAIIYNNNPVLRQATAISLLYNIPVCTSSINM